MMSLLNRSYNDEVEAEFCWPAHFVEFPQVFETCVSCNGLVVAVCDSLIALSFGLTAWSWEFSDQRDVIF